METSAMRVNPGVEFSKRKQMQAQPPRTICGKENCAPTPSSAGSVALLGVRRSPGTPGLRRRMLKDDLLELLATARLSDLQAELRGLSPASLTPTTAGGFIQACLLYTSPSPRDATLSRMPSSA